MRKPVDQGCFCNIGRGTLCCPRRVLRPHRPKYVLSIFLAGLTLFLQREGSCWGWLIPKAAFQFKTKVVEIHACPCLYVNDSISGVRWHRGCVSNSAPLPLSCVPLNVCVVCGGHRGMRWTQKRNGISQFLIFYLLSFFLIEVKCTSRKVPMSYIYNVMNYHKSV